ncbi:MAG: hypothetical protein WBQ89_09480, partial [Candidatus Acidiferrum sp.]
MIHAEHGRETIIFLTKPLTFLMCPFQRVPECRLDRACGHWVPYDPKLRELDGQEDFIRGTKQMSNSPCSQLG